jgi:hypothetical protein
MKIIAYPVKKRAGSRKIFTGKSGSSIALSQKESGFKT